MSRFFIGECNIISRQMVQVIKMLSSASNQSLALCDFIEAIRTGANDIRLRLMGRSGSHHDSI